MRRNKIGVTPVRLQAAIRHGLPAHRAATARARCATCAAAAQIVSVEPTVACAHHPRVTTSRADRIDSLLASLRTLDVEPLDPALRARVAAGWREAALAEHASIASFGRFALHLLAVAAPPRLVEAAHRAALDEIEHARFSFAIAARFGGAPVGPGPMPLGGDLLGALDLASIAAAAAREGCVDETIAAHEAEIAANACDPGPLREALTLIAEDEARHAELAWAFVKWALETGDAGVRAAIERSFDRAEAPRPTDDDARGDRFGRLSPARRWEVGREAYAAIVKPAAALLLGG